MRPAIAPLNNDTIAGISLKIRGKNYGKLLEVIGNLGIY